MRKLSDFIFLLSNFFLLLACILVFNLYVYIYTENQDTKYVLQACIVSCALFLITNFLAKRLKNIAKLKREKEIKEVVDSIGQP